ncbi:beta-ketoacyl-[acyl-carrier-protein] synthase family protein [Ruficoccus amylovorans]|uniref:3-oxoacyl-[acyl-carrier-protein] synthase 1 n=1 Tax=Ruficoccus amylovorans TaxID=1804625 RepID=A0A842HJG4_9BACT|nr:beta-ketoacyl-[acyl-carrier-protein] synthase family protein [Ruficoccus amylovorans]MBC2596260.1 beta-ketoacyl-[acyl-carrier-protein] synthase family protein [Ruficoccus amylovorans]
MRNVVVTGLGFITSIGNDKASVARSLRELQHGIAVYDRFEQAGERIHLAGKVKDFDVSSNDPEDWVYPERYALKREQLRSMAPHVLYAHCALVQAVEDAGLTPEEISNPETGLFTSSAGSVRLLTHHMERLKKGGLRRASPMGVVSSVTGTLSFNLVALHKILGSSGGFVSACASSGHALGYAWDEIALGRQERVIVIGAEDGDLETILPFGAMRALSPDAEPPGSRPFDKARNGFVGTGGATALVLESEACAAARNAPVYARFSGWGQASDGYNVAISHPEGDGLARAMELALRATGTAASEVEYINAHATSTPIGDTSEMKAIRKVFGAGGPALASTKALTGHGLSLASAMEAGFTVLGMKEGFTPGSAHITDLDPEGEDLNIIRETLDKGPRVAISNSSGFGGANVVTVFKSA